MSTFIFDNGEFARQGKTLRGELNLDAMPRVAEEVLGGGPVAFVAVGAMDALQRPSLDLALRGTLELKCQRCLKPVPFVLDVIVRFTMFADDERRDSAEALDEDLEGLLFDREFDLQNLMEDEILLSLPYASAHDECLADVGVAVADAPQKPNPFAVLEGFKEKLKRGEH